MKKFLIKKSISDRLLMVGLYYKENAPGGMASVIQYYEKYFETMDYYATWDLCGLVKRAWLFGSACVRLFCKMLVDKRVKVVHIHTAADGSFWRKSKIARLAKMMGKKVILHMHASRFKDFYNESDKKDWILKNLQVADKLIVLSESWKDWFVGIGMDREKIEVLHNITDYPQLMPEAKVEDGKVHYLFLGEIGQRKGVFDMLKGVATHREEMKDKVEIRIGGNKNENQLKAFIKNNDLDEFVKFEGFVSGEKKQCLLNWADVFILPSHNEGLPIAILEAMSYGCAIISTPVGGIPEVVTPEKNGLLVTPGDSEQIALAIMRYADKKALLENEGKESLKMVETYLPEYVLNHLRKIYERLMQ
jgi:glycosyltransferase involved in cell wall biosynthesis